MTLQEKLTYQIEKINSILFRDPAQDFPFKNLVFKGGGMKGAAYIGALEVLDRAGILENIERVAGTSSGAITAVLISLGRDLDETLNLITTLDYSKVPQRKNFESSARIPLLKKVEVSALDELTSEVESANRFVRRYGWFSSEYVHSWVQDVIGRYCSSERATFADFRECGCQDLYIVASNLSRRRAEVFSASTTPDVAVADAVRLSISIPLFFEALQFDGKSLGNGDYYVDGGVFDNFPIHIFDEPQFENGNRHYHNGINWETLGCFLYPSPLENRSYEEIDGLSGYMKAVIGSLYSVHLAAAYDINPFNQLRTIKISDCGVEPTDFSIPRNGEQYQCLVNSGRKAAEDYLEQYDYHKLKSM